MFIYGFNESRSFIYTQLYKSYIIVIINISTMNFIYLIIIYYIIYLFNYGDYYLIDFIM